MTDYEKYLFDELVEEYSKPEISADEYYELFTRFNGLSSLAEVKPYLYTMRFFGYGTQEDRDGVIQELQETQEENVILRGLLTDLCLFKDESNSTLLKELKQAEEAGYTDRYLKAESHLHEKAKPEPSRETRANTPSRNMVSLGIMNFRAGDQQKATRQFEAALQIDTNCVGAYLGLIWSLPYEQRKPYLEQLLTFPSEEIKSFINSNKEMLSSDKASLLENVIQNSASAELVRILLESGANAADTYALYYAVISEHRKELVPLLLKNGANPNGEYQLRYNGDDGDIFETHVALVDVIWNSGDIELAKLLITNHANVNYVVQSTEYAGSGKYCNWSLLDMAVRKNNEAMVQLLLKNGADANSGRWNYRKYKYCSAGWSSERRQEVFYYVLSEAIWCVKNTAIVRLLLENGANPNYQYEDIYHYIEGITNNFCADNCCGLSDVICYSDSIEILKLMLHYGADPNTKYQRTWTNWEMDKRVEVTSMIDLAKKHNKPLMVEIISSFIQEKRKIEDINNKLTLLAREQTELQNKIPQIKGMFADTRRKKAETRMAEIKAELIRLEDELKKSDNM